jgi:hypothetical protein
LGKILVCLGLMFVAWPLWAKTQEHTVYRATIWVDPDGCQHWVIDTGFEGFMSSRLDKDGKPVCNQSIPDLQALRAATGQGGSN